MARLGRVARVLAPLAALALNGCAAAAIAPIVAGGMVAKSSTDSRNRKRAERIAAMRAATPVPARTEPAQAPPALVPPAAPTPAPTPASASASMADAGAGSPGSELFEGQTIRLTELTALPAPSGGAASPGAGDPWAPFFAYARDRATKLDGKPGRSALLAANPAPLALEQRPCGGRDPAVLIDLDNGRQAFTGAVASPPPATLIERLAELRAAGVAVIWVSESPAAAVATVAAALRDSGLDPAGRDPLLLVRSLDDRKQTLREDANRDVCVIAIAGDRTGDFDELFDYLRDPASARSYDSLMGAGWFLVPPPLG